MAVFLCLILGLLSLLYLLLHRRNQYWKIRKIPFVEPEIFFGNSRGITKKFHAGDFMRRMYLQLKSKGPIGGIFIYVRTLALVTDLDLVKNILVKDFQSFPNRGIYHDEENDPLSCHLVNLKDDAWRTLRQKLSPAFTSSKLKLMFDIFVNQSNKFLMTLEKETSISGQIEIKNILSRFTIDVIGSAAFGIDCNSLGGEKSKFYEVGLKVVTSVNFVRRAFMMSFPAIAKKLRMKELDTELGNFYVDVVKETIRLRNENPSQKRNDFMTLMMNAMNSTESDYLTFDQVSAQSLIFFLAGYETSSTTLTFCMYELSVNEAIQASARKSVSDVLEKFDGKLTYEAVGAMTYLEQCINGKN